MFSLSASPQEVKVPNYRDAREQGRYIGTAVTYSESLLILAFHLLLPQGGMDKGRTKCLSEEMTFWLLYTLIATRINGAYKDYYATPGVIGSEMNGDNRPTCWKNGAMEDVFLLQCALVIHEPELWTRMAAIGFQLASVFYKAFMHLFVRMLPTASAFRLWDLLFAESSNPNAFPHARHGLVDLAFAVLRSEKTALLQCLSALDIQSHIESALSSLYDPQSMVDLMEGASSSLWGGFSRNHLLKAWRAGTREYEVYTGQYDQQNILLRQLCHTVPLEENRAGSPSSNPSTPSSGKASMVVGLKTKDVYGFVIPIFTRIFPREPTSNCGGMLRPVPRWCLDFSPPMFESNVGQVLRLVGGAPSANVKSVIALDQFPNAYVEHLPRMLIIPCPAGSIPEPQDLKDATWVNEVTYNIPGWKRIAKPVYDAFVDPTLERMSLHEFLIGLICYSKGTACEKASALFDIFVSSKSFSLDARVGLWPHYQHHRVATSKVANSLLQQLSEDSSHHHVAHSTPPGLDPRQDAALHFRVFTADGHGAPKLLGDVIVKKPSSIHAWSQSGGELHVV
jgi:hypothetical protein